MVIDPDFAIKAVSFLLSIAAMVYSFIATRRKDVDENLKALRDHVDTRDAELSNRQDRHDNRLLTLEQTVQSLPGKDDMHQLQLELAKMSGEMREMNAVMSGNAKIMSRLEAIVSRHEDHLLDGGSK